MLAEDGELNGIGVCGRRKPNVNVNNSIWELNVQLDGERMEELDVRPLVS